MTFATTRWSLVLRARQHDAGAARALDELLAAYWQPVYVLYRRLGAAPHDAEDLTQGLFVHLLERGDLANATPERGRFRAFLATCARNFLANERERAAARKRGGGVRPLSLHGDAEAWFAAQPVDRDDPAASFDRRWAETLLERALSRLEQEESAAGRHEQFVLLRARLDGSLPEEPWAELAAQRGTSEGALRVAATRLRARFREHVVAEVRETLADDCPAGEELQHLLAALQAARARIAESR